MKACKVEGCTRPARSFGWCHPHYKRHLRFGDPEAPRKRRDDTLIEQYNDTPLEELRDVVFASRNVWAKYCKSYYGDKCGECGWNETTCDVNHIIPFSKGGKNTIPNGEVLCPNCHAKKHRKLPLDLKTYTWKYYC